MSRLAVQSCFWPLYEVVNGEYKLSYDPKDKKVPVTDWMKPQRRFRTCSIREMRRC
jgi:pyruvate ferredoxin oxidoreductase beta subunit